MVKDIKNFAPSLLVSTELVACAGRFNQIITRHVTDDAFVKEQLADMNAAAQQLEAAIQSKRTNVFTGDLAATDDLRNASFRSLTSFLDGMTGMAIKPDVQRAAKTLADIINRQGKNLDRSSYARKTGAFTAIMDNFKQPDAQAAITLLGIADVVQHLSDAQQAFENLYQTKVTTDAKKANTAAKSQAAEVSYHIVNLIQYVDAHARKSDSFGSVVPELNEAISDIMSKAHGRKTRSQDANVTPVPVPTPAPVVVSPSSKVVPMPQQPEAQAKAA